MTYYQRQTVNTQQMRLYSNNFSLVKSILSSFFSFSSISIITLSLSLLSPIIIL